MKYRSLGRSGLKVSVLGYGNLHTFGVRLSSTEAQRIFDAARGAGVNFFDTADVYGKGEAERMLGQCLRSCPRHELVLATKCYFPMSGDVNDRGLSRKHIIESAHRSLRNLGVDYIDLYQCHRSDEATPLDETILAMDDLIRQGKVVYWGLSRWEVPAIRQTMEIVNQNRAHRPISNQYYYNLLNRAVEREVSPACQEAGLGILAYSPLAQGVLTGKYSGMTIPPGSRGSRSGEREQMWQLTPEADRVVEQLAGIVQKHGISLGTAALAWCASRPNVASVLCGATTAGQMEENCRALESPFEGEIAAEIEAVLSSQSSRSN